MNLSSFSNSRRRKKHELVHSCFSFFCLTTNSFSCQRTKQKKKREKDMCVPLFLSMFVTIVSLHLQKEYYFRLYRFICSSNIHSKEKMKKRIKSFLFRLFKQHKTKNFQNNKQITFKK